MLKLFSNYFIVIIESIRGPAVLFDPLKASVVFISFRSDNKTNKAWGEMQEK